MGQRDVSRISLSPFLSLSHYFSFSDHGDGPLNPSGSIVTNLQSVSSRSSFNNIDKDGSIQDSEEMARVFIIQVSFYWDELISSFLILSYPLYLSLPHPVLTYPAWSCLGWSYTILACRFLPYFILFYPCKYLTFHRQSFYHLPSIFKIPWTSYLIL